MPTSWLILVNLQHFTLIKLKWVLTNDIHVFFIFQFCNFAQVAIIRKYLANFGDTQNMKVGKS